MHQVKDEKKLSLIVMGKGYVAVAIAQNNVSNSLQNIKENF